jgi:hypothetical protein
MQNNFDKPWYNNWFYLETTEGFLHAKIIMATKKRSGSVKEYYSKEIEADRLIFWQTEEACRKCAHKEHIEVKGIHQWQHQLK